MHDYGSIVRTIKENGIYVFPFLYFWFFYLLPLFQVFRLSFGYGFGQTSFTVTYYLMIFQRALFLSALRFTFYQAFLTVAFSLLLGIPGGYFLARYSFPGKSVIRDLVTLPFLLPAVVVLLGLSIMYGEFGWVNMLTRELLGAPLINLVGTPEGIIFAHVYYNTSLIIRMTEVGWRSIPKKEYQVAKIFGASRMQRFRVVILPRLIPYVLTSSLLVFLYSFNSFAIVLALGNYRYQTLEVLIYTRSVTRRRFHEASAIAMFLLFINAGIISLYLWLNQKIEGSEAKREELLKEESIFTGLRNNPRAIFRLVIVTSYFMILLVFSLLPLLGVLWYSVTMQPTGESWYWSYQQLFSGNYNSVLGVSPIEVFLNSMAFGIAVMLLSVTLGYPLAHVLRSSIHSGKKRWATSIMSLFILLPLATSAVSLSLGLVITYYDSALTSSLVWVTIIAVQTLVALPFITRLLLSALIEVPVDFEKISKVMGASPWYYKRKVLFPLIKTSILVSGVFAFAVSLGEFGATNYLSRGRWVTMSIGVYRLLFARNLALPSAMAIILIIVSFLAFRIIGEIGDASFRV